MQKNTVRVLASASIVLLLYILIVFLVPFVHTAVFWASFLFTLVSFGVAAAASYIAFVKNPNAKSKFYGFPIGRIGVIYAEAQLVVGLLVMALARWIPLWLAVLVYALGLGTASLGLIAADAVAEHILVQDEELQKNVALMHGLQSKLNQMAAQCDDSEGTAAVQRFAEVLRYSDPVSSEALEEIERDLSAAVDELQAAVIDGDSENINQLCRRASDILAERNRLCKLNKGQ